MAYYNQSNSTDSNAQGMNEQDEEQKQQQAAGQPVQLTSGQSATAGTGPTAPIQNQAAPASSGGNPGFSAYAKANQGMATNKLVNAAQQNVQNIGQQAQNSIGQAQASFNRKVEQGSLANRQQAVQDVANAVAAARQISATPAPIPATTPQTQTNGTAPAAPNPLAGLDQSQVDRFKQVINARYAGPTSLKQAGGYQDTQNKVQKAQTALDNIGSAQGRNDLLRSMFENRGDYSRGQNTLDTALLNSSKTGVANLQNTAKDFGNLQTKLDQTAIAASNAAQNRAREIQDIQNQARQKFTEGKTAEESATEARLDKVQADWEKLPQYLRDQLKNSKSGAFRGLSQEELDFMGLRSGEGLFNANENVIKTAALASRDELISRDEQARQAALAALAGFDQSNQLDTNLRYADASKAGTKSALDAFDKEATRRALDQQQKQAQDAINKFNVETIDHWRIGAGDRDNYSLGNRVLKDLGIDSNTPITNQQLVDKTAQWAKDEHRDLMRDREKKMLSNFLDQINYDNRVVAKNSPDRAQALQAFLNSLDQTNKKQG